MFSMVELKRPFEHDGGQAFRTQLDGVSDKDFVYLLENGKQIGCTENIHQTIRDDGRGRFSVWNGTLFFSSSDGSDCNKNGRQYGLAVLHGNSRDDLISFLEKDDEAVFALSQAI